MTRTFIRRTQQIMSLVLASLPLFVAGCSTVISRALSRASTPATPMYFGGVRTDWMVLSESDTWQPQLYGCLDMPFSLAGDVLVLPYDIYTGLRYTNDLPATP